MIKAARIAIWSPIAPTHSSGLLRSCFARGVSSKAFRKTSFFTGARRSELAALGVGASCMGAKIELRTMAINPSYQLCESLHRSALEREDQQYQEQRDNTRLDVAERNQRVLHYGEPSAGSLLNCAHLLWHCELTSCTYEPRCLPDRTRPRPSPTS